jgi:hypothetical protein
MKAKKKVDVQIDSSLAVPEGETPRCMARCVRCVVDDRIVVENQNKVQPTKLGFSAELTFDDGRTLRAATRLASVLFYGQLWCLDKDGRTVFATDPGLLALVGRAAYDLKQVEPGEVAIPDSGSAEETLTELSIPTLPLKDRPGIEDAWYLVWKEEGKLVKMNDDQWVIEAALAPEFEKYKVAKWKDGKEWRLQGAGGIVRLCTGEVRRWEDLDDAEKALLADPNDPDYEPPTEEELMG